MNSTISRPPSQQTRGSHIPDDMIGDVKPSNPVDEYLQVVGVLAGIAAVVYVAGWGTILMLRLLGLL